VGDGRKLLGLPVSTDELPLGQLCAATPSQVPYQLARVAALWAGASGVLLLIVLLYSQLEWLRHFRVGWRVTRTKRHWLLNVIAAAVLLFPIPLINLAPNINECLFQVMGPLATLGLAMTSTAWLLFYVGEKSRRTGIPFFLIIVILVF